jgi:glycosyltransferase involved in cell wall biosynthesis
MILDIRTLSTSSNENERKRVLGKIKKVAGSFNHTTVISYGIRAKLALCDLSSTILPLGSDIISETNKNFKKFNMLYVGNLSENREIEKTIVGLAHFRELNPNVEITYDIVGGEKNQIDKLKKIAEEKNIKKSIKFHGKVLHSELKPFFDKCNIGVSFVPIKEWYDYQPPTKTYEYINSGLFTIATSTFSNREVIDGTNGLLINDTSESFSEGLSKILVQKNTFDSEKIRKTLIDQSWKNIVNKYLKPLIGTI